MSEPDFVKPHRKPPQLSAADLAGLTAEEVNKARRLGQLADLLVPPAAAVEAIPREQWDKLSATARREMIRTYGNGINPTEESGH